jgi:5-(carboxyamino)imidazole ribonucleotide synthase
MRIGIIGAGQLGQMLGFAARDLGVECVFVDPSDNPPASACGKVLQRPFDDPAALAELAATCDVVTYEFENVPVEALEGIEGQVPIYPPAAALRHSQDRLDEKRLFERVEIPIAGYRTIDSRDDISAAVDALGLPVVVKTRRLGYDGKGQFIVRTRDDIDPAWQALGGQALIAEAWVPFDFEVSAIGARNVDGDVRIYPMARNVHVGGILQTSCSPIDAPKLAEQAATYVHRLLDELGYVGVMALEMFVCGDDLLANELAPRVHNSGHWTIEGSATSQFENHVRAILNRSLGPVESLGHAGMVNLIGEIPAAVRELDIGHLHDYGKAPRPGRKLGHITVTAETPLERDALVDTICGTIDPKSG